MLVARKRWKQMELRARTWGGKRENFRADQAAFAHRARMNGLAASGKWSADLERAAA